MRSPRADLHLHDLLLLHEEVALAPQDDAVKITRPSSGSACGGAEAVDGAGRWKTRNIKCKFTLVTGSLATSPTDERSIERVEKLRLALGALIAFRGKGASEKRSGARKWSIFPGGQPR